MPNNEATHETLASAQSALFLMGLYTTNLGRAWRMAEGADMTEKMQSLMAVLPDALGPIFTLWIYW